MKSFLQAQECWDPVDHGYVEPDSAELSTMTNQQKIAQATHRNIENKAKFWIQNFVDDYFLENNRRWYFQTGLGHP